MGNGKLLIQTQVDRDDVNAATNEGGRTIGDVTAEAGNTGGISLGLQGSPGAGDDYRMELTKAGDLDAARFKYSPDGQVTYYGRSLDGTWDGNGATSREIFSGTGTGLRASRPVAADTDADGIIDTVFVVVADDDGNETNLYKTTTLDGTGAWSLVSQVKNNGKKDRPGLALLGNRLVCTYPASANLQRKYSDDWGATWSSESKVQNTNGNGSSDLLLLQSGELLCVFEKYDGADWNIRASHSSDGSSFNKTREVSTQGNDLSMPSACQMSDGRIICVFNDSSQGIEGRESSDGGISWAALTETLPSAVSTEASPSILRARDNTVYMICHDSSVGDIPIKMSKLHAGEATFIPFGDIFTVGATDRQHPNLGEVGGALWLAVSDITAFDVDLILCKYQEVAAASAAGAVSFAGAGLDDMTADGSGYDSLYSAIDFEVECDAEGSPDTFRWRWKESHSGVWSGLTSNVPMTGESQELIGGVSIAFPDDITGHTATDVWTFTATRDNGSWLGADNQWLQDSLWLYASGSSGSQGDAWSALETFTYAKERCVMLDPGYPTRSSGDNAGWTLVLDMGANNALEVDTVAVIGNFGAIDFQMNDTDSWGSPSLDENISKLEATLAAATWASDGTIYKSGAGLTPKKYIGQVVIAGTTGTPYRISDNTAERLFVRGVNLASLDGEDAEIYADRAWKSFTAQRRRWLRWSIDAHHTPEDYYELPLIYMGLSHPLTGRETKIMAWQQPVERITSRAGRIITGKLGEMRRSWRVSFMKITAANHDAMRAELREADMGASPFIYIPDVDNALDFAMVTAKPSIQWNPNRSLLELEEVV